MPDFGDEIDPGLAFGPSFDFQLPDLEPDLSYSVGLVHGNPNADSLAFVNQTTDFTCAVVSQQMILKQFGIDVGEARLVYDATSNGWLTSAGTTPEDVGKLLDLYGVRNHSHVGGGIESLIAELSRGHKIIAAVDSGELRQTDWVFEDWLRPNGADHALVVTGIDLSNPENPKVYVNDPADPGGAGHPYPLDQFLNAWADSGRYFVATDEAPPGLGDHLVFGSGFDSNKEFYLDKEFWFNIASRVAGAVAAAAVSTLLEKVLTVDTIGDLPMRTLENLTDSQRNQLFNWI